MIYGIRFTSQVAQHIAEAPRILKNLEQKSERHSAAHEATFEALEKLMARWHPLSQNGGDMH